MHLPYFLPFQHIHVEKMRYIDREESEEDDDET